MMEHLLRPRGLKQTGLFLILMILPAIPALGADWSVTNTNDTGAGSLRDALANSAGGDTIRFQLPGGGSINARIGTSDYLAVSANKTLRFIVDGGDITFLRLGNPGVILRQGTDIDFTAVYYNVNSVGRVGFYDIFSGVSASLKINKFMGEMTNKLPGNSHGLYGDMNADIGEYAGKMYLTGSAGNGSGIATGSVFGIPHHLTIQKMSQGSVVSVIMGNNMSGAFGVYGYDSVYICDLSGLIHAEVLGSNDARGVILGGSSPTGVLRIDNMSGTIEAIAQYSATGIYSQWGAIQLGRLSGTVTAQATKWDRAFGIRSMGSINGGSADVPAIIESSGYVSAVSTAASTSASGLAVGIGAGGPMNLIIKGTVKGESPAANGYGYAIRAGYWNNSLTSPAWIPGTADNIITLDGATIVGKIDLGSGSNRLTLLGTAPAGASDPLNDSLIGVSRLVVGNGERLTDWTLNPVVSQNAVPGESPGVIGSTTVTSNATLRVNTVQANPLVSPITVNSGGTLGGSGVITGNVYNSGTVAPGNSIGALTINGNYTQEPGAQLQIEINAVGQSDLLNVTGTATLNGGKVDLRPEPGVFFQAGTDYTYSVLQAQGGVSGTVTIDKPFFTGYVSTYPTSVDVTVRRNTFDSIGGTVNQSAIGSSLENAYDPNSYDSTTGAQRGYSLLADVTNALFSMNSVPEALDAFNRMSGFVHTAIPAVTFSLFNQYMDVQRTRMAGFVSGGPSSVTAENPVMLSARTDTGSDAINSLLYAAASTQTPVSSSPAWGLWIQGYGSLGERRAGDISSKYDYDTAGIIFGFDKKITPSLLLGATVGYSYTKLDMKDVSEDADIKSYPASVYGIKKWGQFYLSGIAAYGYNDYDTDRSIAFADIYRNASTDYNGNLWSAYFEGGYNMETKYFDINPLASAQWSYLSRDGFSESGADDIGLGVNKDHYSSFITSLGFKIKKDYAMGKGNITPELRVRYDHEWQDDNFAFTGRFNGNSGYDFTITSDRLARDRIAAGVGINWQIKNNISLNLFFDEYYSDDTTQHAGMLGIRYSF